MAASSTIQPPNAQAWEQFLERISRSYTEGDRDRYLLERSLSLSSREMQDLYEKLDAVLDKKN